MYSDRIIGKYTHHQPGPMLICIGGMHGNEPAGVKALEEVSRMLYEEPNINSDFIYYGHFIAIKGNKKALEQNIRYIDKDLNRSWTDANLKFIQNNDYHDLSSEQKEIYEILALLKDEIKTIQPKQIIVLDLHTTSASGGIFSITTDDEESIRMAIELHAPVIRGMLNGVEGSSIHFFHGKNMGIPTAAIAFEAGQHQDPLSINRSIAAVINCMRTIGAVDVHHVENKHDDILLEFSKNLPKVSSIVGKHSIQDVNTFKMLPNFQSFQKIEKNQLLAFDLNGEVRSPIDGMILMPFYQKYGEDGFFLISQSTDALCSK
jgi:succinylglutamate desuccinylase